MLSDLQISEFMARFMLYIYFLYFCFWGKQFLKQFLGLFCLLLSCTSVDIFCFVSCCDFKLVFKYDVSRDVDVDCDCDASVDLCVEFLVVLFALLQFSLCFIFKNVIYVYCLCAFVVVVGLVASVQKYLNKNYCSFFFVVIAVVSCCCCQLLLSLTVSLRFIFNVYVSLIVYDFCACFCSTTSKTCWHFGDGRLCLIGD